MDIATILRLLPYIMKAIALAQKLRGKSDTASVLEIIRANGSEVLELVTKAGEELFPQVPPNKQAAAGASRFDVNYVMEVQRQLNELQNSGLEVDGVYGAKTKMAVAGFQNANNLEVDGWAGPNTKRLLDQKVGVK